VSESWKMKCSASSMVASLLLIQCASAIQWLALWRASSVASIGTPSICDQLAQTMDYKQIQFCKKHPGFMLSVQSGASRAIDECKFQFRTRRWNCSTLGHQDQHQPLIVALPMTSSASSPSAPANTKKRRNKKKKLQQQLKNYPKNVSLKEEGNVYTNATQSDGPYKATPPKRKLAPFGPNPIVPGTREAAFVHAISAAGVAHALTRACSAGELDDCGCDRTVRGGAPGDGFQWAGCSDNVHFGTSFSRTFVDAREHRFSRRKRKNTNSDTHEQQVWRALMNLHNNEAGRKIIEKSMRIECKCHGVSGSCELRTCWKAMPSFREIGEILKDKFDSATEVEPRTSHAGSRRHLVPRSPTYKPHSDADLVYLDRSPDYCEFDSHTGSLGTHGRPCNKTSKAIDGCDLLCCNRGYRSHRERRAERCMCKFHWCCSVQCKTCLREVEVHTCM